jgi:hypothetical protein
MYDEEFYREYVCVSHTQPLPCPFGEHHIVSNWPSDVTKVIINIEKDDE